MTTASLVATATSALHLLVANRYGYHRDEFYYLACGRRLAWGYVDHPPVTPLLYRLSELAFGTSQFQLRIVPALVHGASVLLVALLAREMGGDSRAQAIAALGTAVAPLFLTTGHFLGTVTVELVAGAGISLLVARLINGGDPRLWVAVGAVCGVALLNKWTIAPFILVLAVAMLVGDDRNVLFTGWAAVGAAVTAALVLPNIVWQARHGWPQLEFAATLRDYGGAVTALPAQFVMLSGASVLLALPGLSWLLRDPAGRPYRAFAVAFVVVLVTVVASGGKPYYTAAAVPALLAAGAVAQQRWAGWTLPVLLLASGIATAPLSIPLLPLSTANAVRAVNPEIGEMIGWSDLVDVVARVHAQHPDATILTANYGEAGAIELLGVPRGLPQPLSGHNSYWYWAQPRGLPVETIAVGVPRNLLETMFADVREVTVFETPGGVDNEENGARIHVCRDPRDDWAALWPSVRHV